MFIFQTLKIELAYVITFISHIYVIFVADVEIQNTDNSDNLNSFSHSNHHPFSDNQCSMAKPFDNCNDDDDNDKNENYTQLKSNCMDLMQAIDNVPMRRHRMHENGIQDKSPPRSRPLSTYSESTAVPRILITPTPGDDENRRASWAFSEDCNKETSKPFETFELLSSKLSRMYATSSNLNAEDDKTFDTESNDENSLINCQSSKNDDKIIAHSRESDSSQSVSDSESKSESESESKEADSYYEESNNRRFEPSERTRNDSLYEIEDIQDLDMHSDMHDTEVHDSDDESADIIEFIIDNSGDQMSNCDTVEFNDHLSVIFEEDERSHSRRMPLDSMCSSNSSATLANDDTSKHFESEDEHESDKTKTDDTDTNDSDDDDDHSTSVTVRLPLRLSFSRSCNDEEITTVMVGKSEIKVDDINESPQKTPPIQDSSPDVSVSICIPRKNRPPSISAQTSVESQNNKSTDCDEDSDAEISVSFSLPLRTRRLSSTSTPTTPPAQLMARPASTPIKASHKIPPLIIRPAFTRQQTLSPVPRSRDEFEYKVWNRGVSIERDTSVAKSIKPRTEQENNLDESSEMMSFRDRIAAFEAFLSVKKGELQRQNACDTSFDQSNKIEQEQITEKERKQTQEYNNDTIDQQKYENLPQTTEYQEYCDKNEDKLNVEPNKPNYESFVTSQCKTYVQLQPEPAPEYIDPNQHFEQESFKHKMKNEEPEDGEEDYKANLSVQQKIAAFQQPAPNELPKIDARQEICMARENNNQESIGNRFLAKIADTQPRTCNNNNSDMKLLSSNTTQTNDASKSNKMNSMYLTPFEESELEETDSGVDIHRRVSEDVDTESECYSELRKLTRYERAATHSRLFRILKEYENEISDAEKSKAEEEIIMPLSRPKKIVHNVSITRRQNPEMAKQAETVAERRERLQLNYNSSSIDNDNASSSASPSCASPASTVSVNEKLIDELVHSVLKQTKRQNLQNIPIEKIHAAARRALFQQHEENDSCDTYSSFDSNSTPAMTPHEFNDDCYDSDPDRHSDILPSKAFKHLQEQSISGRRYKSWAARCPRVLSSKTVNSDLSRVTETRESQSPEREHQYVYPF